MSYHFGKRSRDNLAEAHEILQDLFTEVIKVHDCAIIEGHRGAIEQNKLFHSGKSKLEFPYSKHNRLPSLAVDVVPWPVDWNDRERFVYFAGIVKGIAAQMGIQIRSGADWDGDGDFKDQTFHDMPHFEIIE